MQDSSELHEIMDLDHARYADHDSEICFYAHITSSPLSRCNGICMQITDNSELHEMMVLGHVRYANHDTEIRLDENTKLSPLSRYSS